jgi:predicted DNA-binding transcriptional regulator AlpA
MPVPNPATRQINPARRYLNMEEACIRIGCSKEWMYARLRGGDGPPLIKKAGRVFFPIAELDAWMMQDQIGPDAPEQQDV